MNKVFVDSNVLMEYSIQLFEKYEHILISDVVLEEIDKHKYSSDPSKRYQARLASRQIEENEDKIEYCLKNGNFKLPDSFDLKDNDNKIINILGDIYNNDLLVLSNDLGFKHKCKCLGFSVISFVDDLSKNIYRGYKEITGDTHFINSLFNEINNGINSLNFLTNEFMILHNSDLNQVHEYRFDGNKFVELRLPSSKVIKGANSLQRCALDLLFNKDIPIVALNGEVGSGKTYSCTRMALHHVIDKGIQNKILVVREALGEGKEVGFLKGTFEDKTKMFFKPIEQSLKGREFELQSLVQNGTLESTIPFYLKGTTFPDTIIICDESEDFSKKQLKLAGTRLGNNSRIFFAGDYKQSTIDYSYNNPLVQMCNELKGMEEFGCIYLEEDVRSKASKIFANLFTGD